jgi:hypothetical protein
MKRFLALFVTAALASVCAACAQGGGAPSGPGSGSITMYGTVDEGITVRK